MVTFGAQEDWEEGMEQWCLEMGIGDWQTGGDRLSELSRF